MIMDAVEVFVLDDDGLIAELRAYWDMSRARTRALSAIRRRKSPNETVARDGAAREPADFRSGHLVSATIYKR